MKKLVSLALCAVMIASVLSASVSATPYSAFPLILSGHCSGTTEKPLYYGVTEEPAEAALTRAELVESLYVFEGEPAFMNDNVFSDVEVGSWYEKAVVWADGKGIVNGYGDDTFGPDDPVTREQMAAIFYRYAQYKELDTELPEDTNFLSFDDVFEISEYAMAPMFWALANGLMAETEGWLYPAEGALDADAAAFLDFFAAQMTE